MCMTRNILFKSIKLSVCLSCSILVLKSLFEFISHCVLVPYLESGLYKDENELDNCDFTGT